MTATDWSCKEAADELAAATALTDSADLSVLLNVVHNLLFPI